jgi:hypothetical protein
LVSIFQDVNNLNLSSYQKFGLNQLNSETLSTHPCFVICLRNYGLDPDAIDLARDIIREALPLKHLKKLCKALGIVFRVSNFDEIGKKYSLKQ